MTSRAALFAAASLFCAAPAFAQASPPAESDEQPVQSCDHRKFETRVAAEVDGRIRSSTVRICGVEGQTDADWKRTLEDSARKVEANDKMASAIREQIVAALKLEISKLEAPSAARATAIAPTTQIPGLAEGIKPTSIAPLATARPATPPPLTPVRPATAPPPRPLEQDYGNLKPLPAPLPPAAVTAVTASMMPRLASPRITLLCSTSADPHGAEECDNLYSTTVFTVRADERLSGDTSLRFLRKGDVRDDIQLAQMAEGETRRIRLPSRVCSGVTRGSVEIQIMRRPPGSNAARQVVDAYGPYDLRC